MQEVKHNQRESGEGRQIQQAQVSFLLLETVSVLKESLLLGVMGGGPGEEEELEEEEGGPGDTERRRSPPIWLRT